MRDKRYWGLVLVVAVALLCLVGWVQLGQTSSRTAWEYKYVGQGDNMMAEKQLNELGAQGWELVGIVPREQQGTVYDGGIYYLKRQKP
jgi:hypothetical protein